MRLLVSLALFSLAAVAQPPLVKDFRRVHEFKEDLSREITRRRAEEEIASKPREEKMLLAFLAGEPRFEGKRIPGKLVVTTCFVKWGDVQQAVPTEAGKRVLALLPEAVRHHYAAVIEIPRDRREVSNLLVEALDSDWLHVREAAIESLKAMYRTATYDASMGRAERAESIEAWRKYVAKQNR